MEAQEIKSKVRQLAVGGAAIGIVAYPIYKIGTLPDSIKNERLYVASALIGGGVMGLVFIGGIFPSDSPKPSQILKSNIATSVCLGSLVYSATRIFLKQNPKKSLITSAIITAGIFAYQRTNGFKNKIDLAIK